MTTPSRDDVLDLRLGLDTKGAVAALDQYTKAFDRDFKRLERQTKQHNKKLGAAYKGLWDQQKSAAKATDAALKKQQRANQELLTITGKLTKAQEDLVRARQGTNAQAVAEIEEQIERLDELRAKYEEVRHTAGEEIKGIKEALNADIEIEFSQNTKDIGASIGDAFSAIASKDALGIGTGMGKAAGKALLAASRKVGGGMARKGAAMQEMPGAGGIAKAIGGMTKGLGSILNIVGKLGPLIGTFGSLAMGLVKIFLDNNAAMTEFNKTVLATSGQVDYLAGAFGNVQVAAADLEDDLRLMYDAAVDLQNIDFGIDKGVFAEVTSTLAQELGSTQRIMEMVKKESKSGADAANQYAKTIQMTVAYSRQMGVSYQEMAQLQGQIMRDTGTSFDQMNTTFAQMARATAESGIASNQFFNIIRGVSADLALYNNRLGDAIKLLGKLGKVMSAKSAEKFMQSIGGAMKNMGRVQRLQTTLLAGTDKTRKIVEADIASHQKGLAKQVAAATGKSLEEVNDVIAKDGSYGLKKLIKTAPKAQQGALMESFSKMGTKKRMATKGTYGLALAAGETGVAGQADMITAALEKFAGGKSLGDAVGEIGVEQMAENLGVSREQVDQLVQFNASMEDYRDELRAGLDKGDPAVLKKLQELGVDTNDVGAAQEALEKLTSQQLMDTMDENEKEALEEAYKIHDYAKETGKFQTSMLDKLDQLLDYFYNWLSKSIMKLITSLPFIGKDDAEVQQLETERAARGDKVIAQLAAKHKGDPEAFKEALAKTEKGQKFESALGGAGKLAELSKKRKAALDREYDEKATPEQKAAAKAEKEGLDKELKEARTAIEATKKGLSSVFDQMGAEEGGEYIRKTLGAKQKELEEKKSKGTASEEEVAQLEAIQNVGAEMLAKSFETKGKDKNFEDVLATVTSEGSEASNAAFIKALYGALQSPEQVKTLQAADKFYAEATNPGSIYTHDIHIESLMEDLISSLTGGPAGGTDPEMDDQTSSIDGLTEEQLEAKEATTASLADIYNVLKIKGIRINQSHLDKNVKKVIFEGSREAMEEALFEYALLIGEEGAYKALEEAKDKGGVASGSALMRGMGDEYLVGDGLAKRKKAAQDAADAAAAAAAQKGTPDAQGGSKDVSGTVTVVGKIEIELKQDLAQYVDARIANWVSTYEQKKQVR